MYDQSAWVMMLWGGKEGIRHQSSSFDHHHHHHHHTSYKNRRWLYFKKKNNPKGMMEETEKTDIGVGGELFAYRWCSKIKAFFVLRYHFLADMQRRVPKRILSSQR
jgi:hypothetical protein